MYVGILAFYTRPIAACKHSFGSVKPQLTYRKTVVRALVAHCSPLKMGTYSAHVYWALQMLSNVENVSMTLTYDIILVEAKFLRIAPKNTRHCMWMWQILLRSRTNRWWHVLAYNNYCLISLFVSLFVNLPVVSSGPVPVLVMSLLFIASVFMLHIWGKYSR